MSEDRKHHKDVFHLSKNNQSHFLKLNASLEFHQVLLHGMWALLMVYLDLDIVNIQGLRVLSYHLLLLKVNKPIYVLLLEI